MATQRRGRAVHSPNLGLYLGVPPLLVPERGLTDCLNVRIQQGRIVHDNLGWSPFPSAANALNLEGKPVLLIDSWQPRGGVVKTVFGNTTDLFVWNDGDETVSYLTPRVENGVINFSSSTATEWTLTGTGTSWVEDGVKVGDPILLGAAGETSLTAEWRLITAVNSDTEIKVAKKSELEADPLLNDDPYTIRSLFTGDQRSLFDTEVFHDAFDVEGDDGDRWYATNGIDKVVAWDGVADQVYRPDLGDIDSAGFLAKHKNIMYYGAIVRDGTEHPFSIRTSAIGSPENVVSAEAAEFIIHDGSDKLLAAHPIGELMAIYGERSITLAQFVGPPLMFIFRSAVAGFGPRSSRSVAEFPDHHLFVGADAQYRFDGVAARPVNNHVWRDLTRQMSPQRLDYLHSHFDEERGELLWSVPLNTDPDPDDGAPQFAFTMHYLEEVGERAPDAHTKRQLPALCFGFFERPSTLTWADISERWSEFNYRWDDQFLQAAFPQTLFGDAEGNVFLLNESSRANGAVMGSVARFSRRPLGSDPSQKGVVRRVYPFLEHQPAAPNDIWARVRTANTADGRSVPGTQQRFSVAEDEARHFVSPRIAARYVEIEFATTSVTEGPWSLSGYDLDVVYSGGR